MFCYTPNQKNVVQFIPILEAGVFHREKFLPTIRQDGQVIPSKAPRAYLPVANYAYRERKCTKLWIEERLDPNKETSEWLLCTGNGETNFYYCLSWGPLAEAFMQRYPRLTAHLICVSLGYFDPASAALAIGSHCHGVPYFCEWYGHTVGGTIKNRPKLRETLQELEQMEETGDQHNRIHNEIHLQVNYRYIQQAFKNRRAHKGYMADYHHALALVRRYLATGESPNFGFMSW